MVYPIDTISDLSIVHTGATAPATGRDGDLWYNTTTNTLMVHVNGAWSAVSGVRVRGVTAGADQGSVQATFNNDAITAADGEVLIYTYNGSAYVYTGAVGDPVTGATAADFTVLGAAMPFATSAEVLAGTAADKLLSPKNLADNAKAVSAGAADASKYVRLNASGKIDATMLDAGGLKYSGAIDVTAAYAAPSPAPVDGNFYTVSKTGTVDASWNTHMDTPPSTVAAGDLAFYANNVYYLVESAQDASSLVHKSGANAILADMSMTWTAPAADGTVIIDGANAVKSVVQNITLDSSVIDGGTYT